MEFLSLLCLSHSFSPLFLSLSISFSLSLSLPLSPSLSLSVKLFFSPSSSPPPSLFLTLFLSVPLSNFRSYCFFSPSPCLSSYPHSLAICLSYYFSLPLLPPPPPSPLSLSLSIRSHSFPTPFSRLVRNVQDINRVSFAPLT